MPSLEPGTGAKRHHETDESTSRLPVENLHQDGDLPGRHHHAEPRQGNTPTGGQNYLLPAPEPRIHHKPTEIGYNFIPVSAILGHGNNPKFTIVDS